MKLLPRLGLIAIILFFFATLVMVTYFNLSTPRVLILHSYSRDYPWSNDVDIGIRRIFGEHPDYALRWFYLEFDRHNEPRYYEYISRTARRFIDQWQPDIVIAIDDEAQEYVMKYYVDDPEIRIVFAGVNSDPAVFNYDQAENVTGILERNDLAALKEVLIQINTARHKPPSPYSPVPIRERPRTESAPLIIPPQSQENCSLEISCPRLFPQWRGMFAPGLRDRQPLEQLFSWSPLRLTPAPESQLDFFTPLPRRDSPARLLQSSDGALPGELRFIHLGDNSTLGKLNAELIQAFDWRPLRLIESRPVTYFSQWQEAVTSTHGRADILLISDYRDLSISSDAEQFVAVEEVVRWTIAHSPLPVIATDGDFVAAGGYLALSASPFEQGSVAAQMTLDLLNSGLPATSLPITQAREFTVFMRGARLTAAGIHLPRIYETFARATNSYWDN